MDINRSMSEVCSRWCLPKNYISFLNCHEDNIYASVTDASGYADEIEIYGAAGFITGQMGYSYNPAENTAIDEWDSRYVVIANSNSDPYCIDITQEISPVYYAAHGEGEWAFSVDSESLEEFLDFWGVHC